MKRITDYRKLFEITKDTDLAELKLIYLKSNQRQIRRYYKRKNLF